MEKWGLFSFFCNKKVVFIKQNDYMYMLLSLSGGTGNSKINMNKEKCN